MAIEIKKINRKKKSASTSPGKESDLWKMLNSDIKFGSKFGDKKKERFYNQLSTLFQSGIDLRSTLELVEQEQEKSADIERMSSIKQRVETGDSLSEAMEKTGDFTRYETYSIKIGEESGRISEIFAELGLFFEKKMLLKRQMMKVFSYPAFVILITGGIVYFMLNKIVPMFEEVFSRFNAKLPTITQMVIDASNWFSAYSMYFLLGFSTIFLLLFIQRKKEWFRNYSTLLLIKFPLFGKLIKKVYLARMCQSLNLLIAAKTPLIESIELLKQMIGFYPIEKSLGEIKVELEKGVPLHVAMSKYSVYEKRLVSLIKVGEEVNQLDAMFGKLAKQYSDDVEYSTTIVGTILEPLMIVLVAGVVGFILVAMYLPLFNIGSVMGG